MSLLWHNEKRKVCDLLEMPENPRQLTKEQAKNLEASFKKFDLVEIPVIDTDNTLIAGHQRMKIMQMLGRADEEIDVRVPNRKLTDTERKEYNLRSNKNTGEWDNDKLAQYFDEEMLKDVGFTEDEIAEALQKTIEGEEDDFDTTPPVEPKTKLGDIFILGEHVLMCGDSTKKEDVDKLMGGEKADMVFTDPPYGYSYKSNHQNKHKELLNDNVILDFLPLVWMVSNENVPVYIFCGFQTVKQWIEKVEQADLKLKNIIIWKKNNWSMGDLTGSYAGQYEMILFAHKGRVELSGERDRDVWEFDRVPPSEHPTTKPVSLVVKALQNHKAEIVLDVFGGCGTTLIACEQTGRKCRMMELDPKYCDVIIARWEKLTGKTAEKCLDY